MQTESPCAGGGPAHNAHVFDWASDALLGPPTLAVWNPWGDVIPPHIEAPGQEEEYPSSEFARISLQRVTIDTFTGAIRHIDDPKRNRSR
jgi:hypothetical protein